ncbi:hypothetical protein LTR27_010472 [Elasticomyces elasticus]|nr:hypothetical protein LTR27_010472 [Elasticomyces elasticus]
MSTHAVNGKTFFDLPPEIRNAIYTLALARTPRSRHLGHFWLSAQRCPLSDKPYMKISPEMPELVNTSLQIAGETLPMFYSFGFILNDGLYKSLFMTARGKFAKKHIKHFIIKNVKYESNTFRGTCIRVPFWLVVYVEEGGSLDIHSAVYDQNECMCELTAAMRASAVQRCSESNGDVGLAYAAVECFFDEHLPVLQDKRLRSRASQIVCSQCNKKKVVYNPESRAS